MAQHFISREQATSGFSVNHTPALRVRPGDGDEITVETSDEAYVQMAEFHDLSKVTATINPITGPIYVEGAQPGDALVVTILDIQPIEYGWSIYLPGIGALAAPMGAEMFARKIPISNGQIHITERFIVPVRPMIGCIGVAPATGESSTIMPSYAWGGNMDITYISSGATVLLPVQADGAYLSIGDLHASMGRGEASFVAIEGAGRATITVDLIKGKNLRAPRIITPTEIITVGLANPHRDAIAHAYEDLFAYLTGECGWDTEDTYAIMSACAPVELGGPTGSESPIHPFTPEGAVVLAKIERALIERYAAR